MALHLVTTVFFLSNLHCKSCVALISDTLNACDPRPFSVSASIPDSTVIVEHDRSLLVKDIRKALEDAGFNIREVAADSERHLSTGTSRSRAISRSGSYLDRIIDTFTSDDESLVPQYTKQQSRHLENCELCRLEAAGKGSLNLESQTSNSHGSIHRSSHHEAPLLPLVVVDSDDKESLWQATLSIGGMTCASCVGAITEAVSKKDWVRKVVINLISNSGTIDFIGEEHKNELVEIIEDLGYEAVLDNTVDLTPVKKVPGAQRVTRTVDVLVDGMYCDHCPGKVSTAIGLLRGHQVEIKKALSLQDPVLKLQYTPNVPDFTIRNILAAISASDSLFRPSIFRPPSLEARSRQIQKREQLRLLLRVLLTFVAAIPTLIIGIIYMSLVPADNAGRETLMTPLAAGVSRIQWALFILATPVYFFCADVFHVRAIKEITSLWRPGSTVPFLRRFYKFGSMNMLVSLGTSIAYWSSVGQLIAAGLDNSITYSDNSFYFDSVVFLTLFLLIGRLIESYSKAKTGDAVALLRDLTPTEALLVEAKTSRSQSLETLVNDETVTSTIEERLKPIDILLLEVGDIVKVLQGASPPCDGVIVDGETKFDESSLTGESRLVKKVIGDEVFSGTVNMGSPVKIKITGAYGQSMLDQIVRAVREGQTRRAPMERIADTLTSYFVPLIIALAILTWVVWLSLGSSGALPTEYLGDNTGGWVTWSLQFAIAVFVVACPCGLGLAAPTALFVGGGLAAKHGILAKGGGEAFEMASKLDCIVFDKTGTLTMGGEPVVTDHQLLPTILDERIEGEPGSQGAVLGMVGALEGNSSHTVAKALVSFCKEPFDITVENIEEIAGHGMKGKFSFNVTGEEVEMIIGNEGLLLTNSVPVSKPTETTLENWKLEGKSVALAAIKIANLKTQEATSSPQWQLVAIFAISDPIRPEAPGIIQALHARGTDVWMLSGDNQLTATAIGAKVGIPSTNIIAGVLPSQKAEKIQYLQRCLKSRFSSHKRALVAMVGDGINDSPALTTADVGIAIGSGSDIAISSAEFVLVGSNLNSIVTLLELSKMVFRRIKFNFGWALVYNLIGVPVAAGVLYPIRSRGGEHVRLDPVWASLAMAMSSISVVVSSLALRSRMPGVGFRVRKEGRKGGE